MLNTAEILTRLDERGIKNAEVAKVLGVTPSRVTEIRKGQRAVKLDEGAKLVEAFALEQSPSLKRESPLPTQAARLIVRYIALELRCQDTNQAQIEELAEDVRAFAEFVADPKVRESIEAAEAFFQAMRLRRPTPEQEDPR